MINWNSKIKRAAFIGMLLVFSGCTSVKTLQPQIVAAPVEVPEQPKTVSIAAVGDIMLGGKGLQRFEREGYDFPFAATRDVLQSADIAIGNLETSLTRTDRPFADKQYVFHNNPDKVAQALRRAGFDIVSLANNHSMDYGEQGLRDTFVALDSAGIRHLGAGLNLAEARRAQVFHLDNGQTAAFLAYSNTFPEEFWAGVASAGTAFGHEYQVREDVARLAAQGIDVIVVSFHWGRERQTELRGYQPLLAHAAIDAGADLVIGHHPHILQAVERYKNGLILYSLGNYTFSTFSSNVNTGGMAKVNFVDGRFAGLELTPINVNNFDVQLQPGKLDGQALESAFTELNNLSLERGTRLRLLNGVITIDENKPNF